MPNIISAAEARRRLPELTDEVRQGKSYTIVRHGKPVAQLVPPTQQDRDVDPRLEVEMKEFFTTYDDVLTELAKR